MLLVGPTLTEGNRSSGPLKIGEFPQVTPSKTWRRGDGKASVTCPVSGHHCGLQGREFAVEIVVVVVSSSWWSHLLSSSFPSSPPPPSHCPATSHRLGRGRRPRTKALLGLPSPTPEITVRSPGQTLPLGALLLALGTKVPELLFVVCFYGGGGDMREGRGSKRELVFLRSEKNRLFPKTPTPPPPSSITQGPKLTGHSQPLLQPGNSPPAAWLLLSQWTEVFVTG